MLSSVDLERLIAVKMREIETEKLQLGLSPHTIDVQDLEGNKENVSVNHQPKTNKQVAFVKSELSEREDAGKTKKEGDKQTEEEPGEIPADLERYIRRYLGLPVMLKAGEFSPNNPLLRGSRVTTDALFSLGEYERQRDTLRKIQQKQYREYLDQQAKKKQDEKERKERERREREEREDRERIKEEQERIREERERDRLRSERERTQEIRKPSIRYYGGITGNFNKKVDTAVQVDSALGLPLSVAVQTDDAELYMLSSSHTRSHQAERELSPRLAEPYKHGDREEKCSKSSRGKLLSDLRHTYMPSIFDAEAIRQRNLKAEKEAAERRLFYQQELKNQIQEQQRIREERKNREKLLEQAEMRRLEEQLKMLKLAQEKETNKQRHITTNITENTTDYQKKRKDLQTEIDKERSKLRSLSQPLRYTAFRDANTSQSDPSQNISKLPFYYPSLLEKQTGKKKPPFSSNIPENSIFSPNYDVDAYLRKNLNPSNDSFFRFNNFTSNKDFGFKTCEANQVDIENIGKTRFQIDEKGDRNVIVEKALVHNPPVEKKCTEDSLPIPVLRHSPRPNQILNKPDNGKLSEAMKVVDDKWKVPIVQKNILKSVSNDEGRNVNILTQLGSIRRQLQLEQLKLDNLVKKDGV